jgi:UDP-glucose 4-epimerase
MTKILVTGGAGFIGSNLCKELSKDSKNTVVSIDNYSSGSEKNHHPGVEYFNLDTKDIELLNFNPDIIYHLGEYSRVEESFHNLAKVFDYNSIGTFEVINFACICGAKLIYAGSSTKFGDNGYSSSPYAFYKSQNTELVKAYSEWYGLDYAITYFYNVYGNGEVTDGEYATVIGKFKKAYLEGKPIQVVSPGTQRRNFTHIDDIISGLILVGNNGSGDDFCIGNRKSYTILEVARMFGNIIEFLPERKGNRNTSEIDLGNMYELGWSHKMNLEDYINEIKGF